MGVPPLKVRLVGWKLATDTLATMEIKASRNLAKSDICVFCGVEREDTFHVFCRCPMGRALWCAMEMDWAMPKLKEVENTGPEWVLHLLEKCTENEKLAHDDTMAYMALP